MKPEINDTYPTYSSLEEAVTFITITLPITDTNQLLAALETLKNTLLYVQSRQHIKPGVIHITEN
jgi:hypothetical protein